MATSGSFNTTAYGSYNRCLTFSWTLKSQSTANNQSVITWELKGAGGSSTTNYYYSAPFKLIINGEEAYYSETRIQLKNGTVIATGEAVISHNADGTKTFTASAEAAIYSYAVNVSGSGSWELTRIPRAATLTAAPNFNDEVNPTITYSNLAGDSVTTLQACISLTGSSADVSYRDISKTGTTYTFNLTSAERAVLRNATTTANSRKVHFYIKTVIGSNTYYSSKEVTLSIINATPTLSPTVVDTNSTITALTKDANILVKYYSNAKCTSGAAALKSATVKSIKITCGSKSLTADGTINAVESGTFTFTVTDSRGNTATKTVTKNFSNYIYPTVNLSGSNITTDGKTTIKFSGKFYNSWLGGTQNTLTLQYCYNVNGGSYGSWVSVTPTKSNHTYTASVNLIGLNYQNTYKFKAKVADKLNTITTGEIEVVSKPVFEWGKDVFCINANKTEGNIYGLGELEKIPDSSDFNDYLTVGVYSVSGNANAETMLNIPTPYAGRLIVYSSTGTATNTAWSYIIQEYHTLYPEKPVYKRKIYTSGTAGSWTYGNWLRDKGSETLWSGAKAMTASETIPLSAPISEQPNGVVLRFSSWDGTTTGDAHFTEFFVPKGFTADYSGKAHSFLMARRNFAGISTKYLFMKDTNITGYDTNVETGTANGITFNNNSFCLREVIGV